MRKIIILPVALLLVITSCKKSSSHSVSGAITANIDGIPTSFNTEAIGTLTSYGGVYELGLTAFQGAISTSNQITIGVAGSTAITPGIYGDQPGPNTTDEVSLAYTQQPGTILYGASGTGTDTASVTITSISSTEAIGTFTGGVIVVTGTASPTEHIITNGKFDVKIQ
jgi:hypothetical protein